MFIRDVCYARAALYSAARVLEESASVWRPMWMLNVITAATDDDGDGHCEYRGQWINAILTSSGSCSFMALSAPDDLC